MELNSILAALFLFLLLVLFVLEKSRRESGSSYSKIPGPRPLPLIGNLHQILRGDPHRTLRDLAAQYGPLMHLQVGEVHTVVVSSPAMAKQVLTTHDINFSNRPEGLVQEKIAYNYTDIIFAPYGDSWRQLKKICTLELLSARRVLSFRPIREEECANLCRWIASCEGSPVNLSRRLFLLTNDVIARAMVGAKNDDAGAMTALIEEMTKLTSGFSLADLYPSVKSLPLITGLRFRVRRMRAKIDHLLDGIIERHRSAVNTSDGAVNDLLDVLLQIQRDGTELPITTDSIKAVMLNMFTGGTDTSAITVEWAMSELIKNPRTLRKAQEELRKVFDDKGYVEEEKFDELKYLKLIIKETLRVHPPGPLLIPRVNTERCKIDEYEIPAGTKLIVHGWAMGRDPKYWNDAEEFKPERFEERSFDFKGNNLEYIPFGAGRRMCPGISFGLSIVEFPLASLLYHFDWETLNGIKNEDLDMTESFGGSVHRKHHLHLIPTVKRPLRP